MTRSTNLAKRASFTLAALCAVLILTPTAMALGPDENPSEKSILEMLRNLDLICVEKCELPTPPICEKACSDPLPPVDAHRRISSGNICVASARSTACASAVVEGEAHSDAGDGQPTLRLAAYGSGSPCIPTTINPCSDGETGTTVEEPPSCGFGCGPDVLIDYLRQIINNTRLFGDDVRSLSGKILGAPAEDS